MVPPSRLAIPMGQPLPSLDESWTKRLNRKVDELTRRVEDQSNLVDRLLKQINLVRDFGPRSNGEETRMGERTGRHLEISRGDQARTSRQEGRQECADQHAGISRASVS
ncbi:hypothetical protein GBA52_003525 [Prunus armeniaca]|nr:hypothetical protein GBA52_003525 [Prunus armeniaca]